MANGLLSMGSSLSIILLGEKGVGKSSAVNLIAGRQVADTSPDVQSCTMSFKPYTFPVKGRDFHIWDTIGLDGPGVGINSYGYLSAIEQSFELIQHLRSQGGVDLLPFCIRGSQLTATTQSNYRLFYEVLAGPMSRPHSSSRTSSEKPTWRNGGRQT